MIAETNYCAQAVDDLVKHAASLIPNTENNLLGKICRTRATQIESAIKFRFPRGGDLLSWHSSKSGVDIKSLIESYATPFRLPFPVVAIEFQIESKASHSGLTFDSVIAVAEQIEERITVSRLIRMKHQNHDDVWIPGLHEAVLSPEGIVEARVYESLQTDASNNDEDRTNSMYQELGFALWAVIELISALSCRNVKQRVCHEPVALNKKRIKNGNRPFYSYRILEIDEGKPATEPGAGGSHASPRVHLRRGHIRRLPDRNVWVNACVVGNKALGMVSKDYAFKAGAGERIAESMH